MAKLRDRTRRLWTTLLFFLGGPTLLGLVAFRLYWRTTDAALDVERARLTAATPFDVDFADRQFLRPGVRRYLGATFSPPSTAEPAVFCPEIYFLTNVDDQTLTAFVRSFDERSGRVVSADFNEDAESADSPEKPKNSAAAPHSVAPSTASLLFDEGGDLRGDALLAVVPTIYCRDFSVFQSKNIFCAEFLRLAGPNAFAERPRALCVVAEQVVFQDETAFRETLAAAQAVQETPTPRSTNDLRALFRVAATQTDRGAADVSTATTEREVVAFASEAPTLERFRALYVDSPERKRTEALFEPRKISAPRPLFVSLETARDAGSARFAFDSGSTPTPSVFAARFFPFFRSLSPESWFVGSVSAGDAPDFGAEFFPTPAVAPAQADKTDATDATASTLENAALLDAKSGETNAPFPTVAERVWTTRLDGFRVFRCDLQKLTSQVDLPRFSGVVAEFSVERGATRRGVFLGAGSLRILDGAFPHSFWSRLCAENRLRVHPSQTLVSYRFMNDATPFNEFEILFETRPEGLVFDSRYPNKIVAVYQSNDLTYSFYLDKSTAGRPLPYAEPLRALFATQDARDFWTPLMRAALNHLPIERAVPNRLDSASTADRPRLDALQTSKNAPR